MSSDVVASRMAAAAQLAALTVKAAGAYGRPDLVESAERLESEARAPQARVAVTGDFKRGKSSLVNGLLDTDLCTTDESVSTTIPTVFRHGAEPELGVVGRDAEDGEEYRVVEATDLAAIHRHPGDVFRVEAVLDRPILGLGLEVVDCPAAAGDGHPGRSATLAVARVSDAVLYVTDTSQPMTAFEIDLVRDLEAACPFVVVVATKTDISPDWRRIVEIDRRALTAAGLDVEILPVSNVLRQAALLLGDRDVNVESGFVRLIELIRDRVAENASHLMVARMHRRLTGMLQEMIDDFSTELEVLSSPEAAEETLATVTAARKEAEGLRLSNARWQRMLAEGAQDVQVELEHRLTQLSRSVVERATEMLEELDPAKDWETFEPWLRETLIEEVEAVFAAFDDEMTRLATRISEEFGQERASESNAARRADLDELALDYQVKTDRVHVVGGGMTALRSSYSGLLMFGMLGSLFGFALLNPVTIALGLTVGGKALWDERTRMAKTRRTKAVATVRQFVDESIGGVRKELRIAVRTSQREIRDEFVAHAERLAAAADEAFNRARAAAQADSAQRAKRRADVEAELGRLRELVRRVDSHLGEEVR